MVTARNEQYQNKLTDVSEGSDFYGLYSTRLFVNALVLHTELKEHKKSGTLGIKVFFSELCSVPAAVLCVFIRYDATVSGDVELCVALE